jgi:hypothetical protein
MANYNLPAKSKFFNGKLYQRMSGDGKAVLKHLAPYVNRAAISDNRVVACDDNTVTFRFTPTGKKRSVTKTVTGTASTATQAETTSDPAHRPNRIQFVVNE